MKSALTKEREGTSRVGPNRGNNGISVHAISILSELRVLRSRAIEILQREAPNLYLDQRTFNELTYMVNICEELLRKVERTGEYIADLQAEVYGPAPAQPPSP